MKTKNFFLLLLKVSLFSININSTKENRLIERPITPQPPNLPTYYYQNISQDSKTKEFLNKQYEIYTHQYHRYILAWQKYELELKAYDPHEIPSRLQQRQYYAWDAPAKNAF